MLTYITDQSFFFLSVHNLYQSSRDDTAPRRGLLDRYSRRGRLKYRRNSKHQVQWFSGLSVFLLLFAGSGRRP